MWQGAKSTGLHYQSIKVNLDILIFFLVLFFHYDSASFRIWQWWYFVNGFSTRYPMYDDIPMLLTHSIRFTFNKSGYLTNFPFISRFVSFFSVLLHRTTNKLTVVPNRFSLFIGVWVVRCIIIHRIIIQQYNTQRVVYTYKFRLFCANN